MNKKSRCEVTMLFYAYVNEDAISTIIKQIFDDIDSTAATSAFYVGRYDVFMRKKSIKINMMCCYVQLDVEALNVIKTRLKHREEIGNFMVIRKDYKLIKGIIDYKYPIEMKKYTFESMRIIPRELTCFSKRKQGYLAKNIKRARILGLLGR